MGDWDDDDFGGDFDSSFDSGFGESSDDQPIDLGGGSGGFGDDGFGDTFGSSSSDSSSTESKPEEKKKKFKVADGVSGKKKTAIILMFIGFAILLILGLFMKKGDKSDDEVEQTSDKTEKTVTQAPVQNQQGAVQVETRIQNGDWISVKSDEMLNATVSVEMHSLMTITGVDYYVRRTEGKDQPLEALVWARGSVNGLSGTYAIALPFIADSSVLIGQEVKVSYKLATVDGTTIVTDMNFE